MAYNLLLADDEMEIRNGLSTYFPWHEVGFEIVALCDNGRKVLDYIQTIGNVDVLLCDIRMPIMDGIEVARTLHSQRKDIKIVFLSGYRDFEYAKQALIYEVKNYIVKPSKFQELYDIFSSLKLELDEERAARSHPSDTSYDEKVIGEVKAYVERCYAEATLEEAARRVHMNAFYLSKYFKDKTGQTFSQFVLTIKMQRAAELLSDIQYKTYHVSELVGYSCPKNFTRAFKNYYGKSPREFRNASEDKP